MRYFAYASYRDESFASSYPFHLRIHGGKEPPQHGKDLLRPRGRRPGELSRVANVHTAAALQRAKDLFRPPPFVDGVGVDADDPAGVEGSGEGGVGGQPVEVFPA